MGIPVPAVVETMAPELQEVFRYLCRQMQTETTTVEQTINQTNSPTTGESFVDRGDPATYDFDETDLTLDGTWRELDLSRIVPSSATRVLLSAQIEDTFGANGDWVHFRDTGKSNNYNVSGIQSGGGAEPANHIQDVMVMLSSQAIDYKGYAGGEVLITVRGWWA